MIRSEALGEAETLVEKLIEVEISIGRSSGGGQAASRIREARVLQVRITDLVAKALTDQCDLHEDCLKDQELGKACFRKGMYDV